MELLLIILVILLLCGGLGGWGYRAGWYGGNPGYGLGGIVVLVLVVFLIIYLLGGVHGIHFGR